MKNITDADVLWEEFYDIRFIRCTDTRRKAAVKITPFTMEDKVSAHQIPFNPREVLESIRARGILEPVNTMLIMLQSFVLPRPDNAPTVISSTHIKASPIPMIIR